MNQQNLPSDPAMLLSLVNMRLRDYGEDLDDLCAVFGIERNELEERLKEIDYEYDEERPQFV